MRNLKKFLALVLALVMAFSLMVTASAANEADNGSNKYPDGDKITAEFVEAVDVLNGMGIMTGDYGNFYADRGVMRSEMAAVLYRLMTGDTGNYKNELYANLAAERFYDVKATDWFASYVGWCYDAGIMVGSGGYFRPSANVTGYETEVMVLRAMGYGKNHEYTGAQWKINASYDATVNGLLRDVVNTNYSSTLSANTRRDVVASIVFQAAQLPTVTWTPSLGYNKYKGVASAQGTNEYNPSLGEVHFGLTCATGIVVGNQATGESSTKIGFSSAPSNGTVNSIMYNGNPSGDPNQVRTGAGAYVYDSKGAYDTDLTLWNPNGTDAAPAKGNLTNATLSFNWTTDLYMFNHAAKVWYDCRDAGTKDTYALYDKVTATAIVTSDAAAGDLNPALLAGLMDGTADNANNWSTTRMAAGSSAFFNYSFAAMNAENRADDLAAAVGTALISGNTDKRSEVSPVKNNQGDNDGTDTQHPLYLLISNSANNQIDVVISLELTMSQIVQKNTTTGRESVGVTHQNGAVPAIYFDTFDDVSPTNAAQADYASIAVANLKNSPKTDLGTKVAAIAITGTAGPHTPTGDAATVNSGYARLNAGTKAASGTGVASTTVSSFYYQLTENTKKLENATVYAVDYATQNVTLSTGDVLHQSVLAEATDGSFTTNMEGATGPNTTILQAGRSYDFILDEQGNYIYWETASVTSDFVYGTYIDFETAVASSSFNYPLVYVKNGEQGKDNITGIDWDASGTVLPMDVNVYGDHPAGSMLLPKRDNAVQGNVAGFVPGKYIGYALSTTGVLRAVTSTNMQGTGFQQATNSAGDFGEYAITIQPSDVSIGAKVVGNTNPNLYLTENTQFYLVDGAGTANQKVTPFKGISKLMEGMDSVVIDVTAGTSPLIAAGDYLAADASPWDMVYYQAGNFTYDQSYAPSAREVKTVYIPVDAVTFNASMDSSLIFVGQNESTLVNAIGRHATKFNVVRNGVIESLWMDGWITEPNTASAVIADDTTMGDNVFYRIVATNNKAADGDPIYTIRPVANTATAAERLVIGKYYNWITSTTPTVSLGTTTINGSFYATTWSQQVGYIAGAANLYNVGSAKVLSLNNTYAIENVAQLCGASSLTDNIGVPVSCILNTDAASTVSYIYVNAVATP